MEEIKIVSNPNRRKKMNLSFLDQGHADGVLEFHKGIPDYKETPLVNLDESAKYLGLRKLWIKDESGRFGLNAFKALGGSYAVAKYLADRLGIAQDEFGFGILKKPELHKKIKDMTFVTATDGNHGRGIAWTARQFGVKAVVYMPKGSSLERFANIQKEGAHVEITDMNYDDTVRFAKEMAEKNGWILMQDTSWDGYEQLPSYIIQGYLTMVNEAHRQLSEKPTHILIQAGVGALASAVCGFFHEVYGKECPKLIVVEAQKADCLYRTAEKNDGKVHFVSGDLDTIMAGLACGEPCTIGVKVLGECADYFVSCPDYVSADGVRFLKNPYGKDQSIIAGESGSVTAGLIFELFYRKENQNKKKIIGLDEDSKVLCFNTEGATNLKNFYRILWEGQYSASSNSGKA